MSNTGLTATPEVFGAGLSVATSTALAALDVSGMTPGTQCYNLAVASPFTLTVSTASLVNDQVVAVAGVNGVRWIINSVAAPATVVTSAPVSGTGSSGSPVTIAANAITNTSLATMAANTVKGSVAGGTPADLTATQVATLLPTASPSVRGVVAATDFANFNDVELVYDWYGKQHRFAQSLSSNTFTGFRTYRGVQAPIIAGINSISLTYQDKFVEGGAVGVTTTGQHALEAVSINQTSKTGTWFAAFRAQFAAQSGTGTNVGLGFGDSTTGEVSFYSRADISASHWYIFSNSTNTIGTKALDTSWHDFVLYADGTNLHLYIDQVLDATVAQSTTAANGHFSWFIQGSTVQGVNLSKALYAYVGGDS
jgi:hypothetical protein